MTLDDAIAMPTMLRMTLGRYIAEPDHSLDPGKVGSPSLCELGIWLNGEGKKYSGTPEFAPLIAAHARCHQAAAEIVNRADAGQITLREIFLGSKSPFDNAAREVVQLMMTIKIKQAAAEPRRVPAALHAVPLYS